MSTISRVARLYSAALADKQSLREAREMFSNAIEIDPGYARAYAGIAECDALLWMSGGYRHFLPGNSQEQHHGVDIYAEPGRSARIQGVGALSERAC